MQARGRDLKTSVINEQRPQRARQTRPLQEAHQGLQQELEEEGQDHTGRMIALAA